MNEWISKRVRACVRASKRALDHSTKSSGPLPLPWCLRCSASWSNRLTTRASPSQWLCLHLPHCRNMASPSPSCPSPSPWKTRKSIWPCPQDGHWRSIRLTALREARIHATSRRKGRGAGPAAGTDIAASSLPPPSFPSFPSFPPFPPFPSSFPSPCPIASSPGGGAGAVASLSFRSVRSEMAMETSLRVRWLMTCCCLHTRPPFYHRGTNECTSA